MSSKDFMREAIRLAEEGMNAGRGGPFGCVVVQGGEIIGRGCNQVTSANDPTAHAEIVAIRDACAFLQSWSLAGCRIYTSCEPCPMCLAAICWANIIQVFFACTRNDADVIGFRDDCFYRTLALPPEERLNPQMHPLLRDEALAVFRAWDAKPDKLRY